MAVPDLETYRAGAEAFLAAIDTETYLHFSGQKPVCDTAAVYDRFPELFTREAVAAIEELFVAAEGDEKYRLAFLAVFAIDGYIGEQTKLLSDEVANTEGRTEITVDGERIGLRQAVVVQANEADGDRRARIQAARLAATDEHLNPLLEQTWSHAHALAGEPAIPTTPSSTQTSRGRTTGSFRSSWTPSWTRPPSCTSRSCRGSCGSASASR